MRRRRSVLVDEGYAFAPFHWPGSIVRTGLIEFASRTKPIGTPPDAAAPRKQQHPWFAIEPPVLGANRGPDRSRDFVGGLGLPRQGR